VIGAESVIGPVLKLVVTVAILAAVGIFIVKPILDTTENISNSVNQSVRDSIQQTEQQTQNADDLTDRLSAQSYAQALQSQWPAAAREIKHCLSGADSSAAVHQCATLGSRLVHTVLSDRLFSLSYADSLAAQGNDADADRVRSCVHDAGFQAGAMHRCHQLADHLLFD
jgi:predicted PurR-regulated permease PerM